MWDMRGGRSPTAQLGAYGPARHPLLAAVRLRAALAAVPGLTQQTHLPGTSLLSLILDALDPRRAAFCLPCGWQGETPVTIFPHAYTVHPVDHEIHLTTLCSWLLRMLLMSRAQLALMSTN